MPHDPMAGEDDRLLEALRECDRQLQLWISQSPANARLLLEDPDAALKAADLELGPDLMNIILQALTTLAEKLDRRSPDSADAG